MKNLIQKILKPLTPLIFAGSLLCANPQPVVAENTSEVHVSAGFGMYKPQLPSEIMPVMEEVYGSTFPGVRVGIDYVPRKLNNTIPGKLSGGVDIRYSALKGEPMMVGDVDEMDVDADCKFSFFTIRPKAQYTFDSKTKASAYLGLAFPYIQAKESANITLDGDSHSAEAVLGGLGIEAFAGVNLPLDKNLSIFIEGSISKVGGELKSVTEDGEEWDVSVAEGQTINIGGLSLEGGIRY